MNVQKTKLVGSIVLTSIIGMGSSYLVTHNAKENYQTALYEMQTEKDEFVRQKKEDVVKEAKKEYNGSRILFGLSILLPAATALFGLSDRMKKEIENSVNYV